MTDTPDEPTYRPYQAPGQPQPEQPTGPYAPGPYAPGPYAQQPYANQPYAQPGYGYGAPGYGQPGYGQPVYPGGLTAYHAPFGIEPTTGRPYSDKTKVTAGLLQLLLSLIGICGVGRLYTGHLAIGLIQLLGIFVSFVLIFVLIGIPLIFGIWLWSVIDGIILLASASTDAQGRLLR